MREEKCVCVAVKWIRSYQCDNIGSMRGVNECKQGYW